METYRRMLYRYSTGLGPNLNVGLPENATNYASYKLKPLYFNLQRPYFAVNVKREADRLSMQLESAEQIIKVLGYNPQAGQDYTELKARVDVLSSLMVKYHLDFILLKDLKKLYKYRLSGKPGFNDFMRKIVEKSRSVERTVPYYRGSLYDMDVKGPYFDQYGKVIAKTSEGMTYLGDFNFGESKSFPILLVLIAIYFITKK